uniref:SBSPON-like C-terminal domain-containing protein n=1 Tax=Parascaris equorum TaxID=6256 RepID=A0A914R6K6_PAREQ
DYCVTYEIGWVNQNCVDKKIITKLYKGNIICAECQPEAQLHLLCIFVPPRRQYWSFMLNSLFVAISRSHFINCLSVPISLLLCE